MQQSCTCGSVRGRQVNWRPYRDLKLMQLDRNILAHLVR
jgi:hypothetical protein